MKTIEKRQVLENCNLERVFDFFSDEKNLEAITPQWLNFKVLEKSTPKIGKGTVIKYRLSIHGIPCRWDTLIEEWQPLKSFIDRQIKGPYKHWHHTHSFQEIESGKILMIDTIRYQVPLGWIGKTLLGPWVIRDIDQIFNFRAQQIAKIFQHPPTGRA